MRKETSKYFGIDQLNESKIKAVMSYIGMHGKIYQGYGNDTFIRNTVNSLDFFLQAKSDEKNTSLKYEYPYFHAASLTTLEMVIDNPSLDTVEDDRNYRKIFVHKKDGTEYAVVNLINADTLPCFVEGTNITAQVIAYPYGQFRKYVNEEAYRKSINKNGGICYPSGTIYPIGYINKYVTPIRGNVGDVDSIFIKGKVLSIRRRTSELFSENEYNQIAVQTDWGKLEIVYTDDQLMYGKNNPVTVGSIISGYFWLEGDPAIYQYENYSMQKSDLLLLLQNTFELGDLERLRRVLAKNVCLSTVSADNEFDGIDAVIERFKLVEKECRTKVFAHIAEITWRKEMEEKGEKKDWYGKGTKCIVLAYGHPGRHETVVFINRDKNRLINRITIENAYNYRYIINSKQERRGYD